MISFILKICKCCDQEVDACRYQRHMRAFGLGELMDETLTKEEEYPPCTTSSSYSQS